MKMLTVKKAPQSSREQHGFTMVELMVALGLSAGLLFGVLQIFDANSRSSRLQNAMGEVQEGGRIAIEMITRDIRMANTWGCNQNMYGIDPNDKILEAIVTLPSPVGVQSSWGQGGVTGSDNVGSMTVGGSVTVEPGTDEFSLRGSFIIPHGVIRQPYMTNVASNIVIALGADIPAGTPLVVSNCLSSNLFLNSQTDTLTTGIITHAGPFLGLYEGNAQIARPFTHQYFVGQNTGGGTSLYRKVDNGPANEIVRNVSDMQVVYGIDGNTNGAAETFTASPSATQFTQVVSMRIQLTLESQSNVNSAGPLQKVYVATANIRNQSLQ